MDRVKAIYGHEPPREGEYPTACEVGSPYPHDGGIVDRIDRRTDNYGDHGIGWFDVVVGERIVASIAQRAVAEIRYFEGEA